MDQQRFDDLTQRIALISSRRGMIRALVGVAVGGLLGALGLGDAAAADPKCRGKANGDGCGKCGICASGLCFAQPGSCGPCAECDGATARCIAVKERNGTSCGDCGVCQGGRCRADQHRCTKCEQCRGVSSGFGCVSTCERDKQCCPEGVCRDADACCGDKVRCAPGVCCDHECCGIECCTDGENCLPNQTCCPDGAECPNPTTGELGCCAASASVCCPKTGICATSYEECCRLECDPCQKCNRDDGTCQDDPEREGQTCETNSTGQCGGICKDSRCKEVEKNQTCGDGTVCCDQGCCDSVAKVCCGGQCCTQQDCCGGECCSGTCVLGLCCPFGFSAAEAELCCPFGPPCGEGNDARCCDEGQHCCGSAGHCCDEGEACCGDACCPTGQHCCDGQCQVDECSCPFGERQCPNGTCCESSELCSVEGCCSIVTAIPCCVDNDATTGQCSGPCCSQETEQCCINNEATDNWCCPKGADCFKDGCCPLDKPVFTAAGNPGTIWCCPEDWDNDLGSCTQSPVDGRRG